MADPSRLIVVDTSAWAAYFNGSACSETTALDEVLENDVDSIAVIPIVLTEVLQGFRTNSGFRSALAVLKRVPVIVPTRETHVAAARMFRRLRSKGGTVRGAVDCVIAQTCIEHEAFLLTLDRDFRMIARYES